MANESVQAQLDCGHWVTVGRTDQFWHCPERCGQYRRVMHKKEWRAKCRRCRFRALESTKQWAVKSAAIHMRKWPGHKVYVMSLGTNEAQHEEAVELAQPQLALPMTTDDGDFPF